MFVNVSSITKQVDNIVVEVYNGNLPRMQIVSSGYEPSIYSLFEGAKDNWQHA